MSALAGHPLIDEWQTGVPAQPAFNNNGGVTAGTPAGPSPAAAASAADLQGSKPLSGTQNTPLHVAALGVLALLIIWALHKAGFRFGAEAHIGG